jgi:hypothetical protein
MVLPLTLEKMTSPEATGSAIPPGPSTNFTYLNALKVSISSELVEILGILIIFYIEQIVKEQIGKFLPFIRL